MAPSPPSSTSWGSSTTTSRSPTTPSKVDLSFIGGPIFYSIRRDDSENARANLEYALDVEDNDLQQDMITMQGLIGKRDNSFSTAAKVIKKVDGTADSILRTVGQ